MLIADFLIYLAIGMLSGFFSGLLGIGGGMLMTPLLIIVLAEKFDQAVVVHVAIASSLAVMIFNSIVSAWTHIRHSQVQWRLALLLAMGVSFAAYPASWLARYTSGALLSFCLGLYLMHVAYKMARPSSPMSCGARRLFSPAMWVGLGGGVGALSTLLGIGGGVLYVRILVEHGIDIKRAIATSAFINLPVSLFATAGYISSGWSVSELSDETWGYVYPPAVAGIAIFSVLFAWAGARMTGKLSDNVLRKIFAGLALIFSLRLLWGALV